MVVSHNQKTILKANLYEAHNNMWSVDDVSLKLIVSCEININTYIITWSLYKKYFHCIIEG